MDTVMKASVFVRKLTDIAKQYKTLYVMGCFGAPMNGHNKEYYCTNHSYNRRAERTKQIQNATEDTFGFDCVNLIKGVLWGWRGDKTKPYGGAVYRTNDVPDINANGMIQLCSDISTDFSHIEVGEAVWMEGHIGVYIGDGLAVECTPTWKNGVQITACNCRRSGYHTRTWVKHGKLPFIAYTVSVSKDIKTVVKNTTADERAIWDFLMDKIDNPYGVAGLMGNLYAESALRADNLQNSFEKKLGYTDTTYTDAVDSGSYDNFVQDSAGYGLAQWTYHTRKKNLLDYAKAERKSIGDIHMQLSFLYKELSESYKSVWNALRNAKSVRSASDVVLMRFERPANQGEYIQAQRATYGQKYYDKYAATDVSSATLIKPCPPDATKLDSAQKFDASVAGSYTVTAASGLHVRSGAGTKKASLGVLTKGAVVRNYGYYSVASNGVRWLYVKTPDGTIGFCSSAYLRKK